MRKPIQIIAERLANFFMIAVFSFTNTQAQIAAWNLTSTTTTATSVNANITASAISVVPSATISYQISPGDIYCGTWSTSPTFSTTGKYWEFSITPNYGYEIAISSLTFKAGRTSAGPAKIQVQYSLDGFITSGITALGETANSNTSSSLDQFSLTSLPPATSSQIKFRIWGYNASSTGNFRLNNIVINGSVNSTTAQGSGIGSASVSPYMFKYNTPTSLRFVVSAKEDTINGIRIIKPSVLNWDTNLVFVTPESIKATFLGDSIQITNVNVIGQDSLVVTIADVNAVDTTNIFPVVVQTYKGTSQFGQISFLPQLLVYGTPRPMSQVKAKDGSGAYLLNSKYIVVEGVVIAANEFGGPTYLQDESAGIAVYDSSVSNNVERGDRVILLGKVSPYYEMFELNPCSILEKVSEGNAFDTLALTVSEIISQPQNGFEPYECRLVRINNITSIGNITGQPTTPWTVESGKSGSNYKIIVGTSELDIRIIAKTNLANTVAPNSPFDVIGVLGQYLSYYQILPRSVEDIIAEGQGPHIAIAPPYESNIISTSVILNWTTDIPGNSIVIYGKTTAYGDTVRDMNLVTQHSVTLSGLEPATIYQIKLGSANESGVTYLPNYVTSTSSQSSTGTINVYFNKSINTTIARGEDAQQVDISTKVIARINAAAYSIDVCLYSLSGTVGANIAQALVNAKNRNVKVRVIGENTNQSTAPWTTLKNAGFQIIDDSFDAINAGVGYMHNKFFIFDNRDVSSDTDDWVWIGSWNATDPGSNDDAQNVVEIQDKALANAYTVEFNEMWGSDTDIPNATNSRFGARKINITPHLFMVNGIPIESYFSPSDRTTSQIIKTINRATSSINFALLSFTRNDVANALIAKKRAGFKVRGIMNDSGNQNIVYNSLSESGIDIHVKANLKGYLHHKYCIIDADGFNPMQYIITGSHNWSSNAEESNDENTLIIQSPRLSNLFLQEFSARYTDAGGSDVLVNVEQVGTSVPKNYELTQNYPNPFNPTTMIEYQIPPFPFLKREKGGLVSLKIYDLLGREVETLVNESKSPGIYKINWDASSQASGVYFYRLQAGNIMLVKKLILLK